MTTKSSLAERLMRGIEVERSEDGRLRAEGMTDYSEHFRIEQDPDGTWRATDGVGVMFRGLDSEKKVWLMANYAYAIATKPKKGETPEETKARIDSTISIKRKMQRGQGDEWMPLLYVFEREPEIERREGFLLAGVLAIDPSITELVNADLEKVSFSIIQSLLRMLQAGELGLQTMGWVKGMAPPGDLTEEQAKAIRAWSLKTSRVNVRVDCVGSVRLQ
jgi:hypothetical protein